MELISIITPIKNGSHLFRSTYESVVSQLYKNFEWIIVDDGSNPSELVEIENVIKDPRVNFIHNNKNKGPGGARNLGLSNISGDYVTFIDSDDLWDREFLHKTLEAIRESKSPFVFTGYRRYILDDAVYLRDFVPHKIVTKKNVLQGSDISCLSALICTSIIDNTTKFGDIPARNDMVFFYNVLKKTDAYPIKEVLATYLMKKVSVSSNKLKALKYQYIVNRNFNFVKNLLPDNTVLAMGKQYPLSKKDVALLEIIKTLYEQQKQMYDTNTNTCKERIVSIYQAHVRPILRGKQNARVEFGAKLGVSLDNGFAYLNHLSWNAYHEGKDLINQVEQYFKIHGYYPDLVQVDKAYSTRENRKWLKERNIRITAPQLGRKPKKEINQYQKAKRKKEASERNHIEAKFGQGKNGYNLNKIRAKLKTTSESWVSCIFFVMNLINYQKKLNVK